MSINKEQIKTWRVDLHQIPELGFQEWKTREYLIKELTSMGFEVQTTAKTGVAVFVNNQKSETLAFRADMDALPILEKTKHNFQSKHQGCMHACGHDGHMAMLLGLAQHLSQVDLKEYNHNFLLIFEPAEEGPGGAKFIVEEGLLKQYWVKYIFGFHLMPYHPSGRIISKAGALMASANEFDIKIIGKGSHIAMAHLGIDALKIGAEFVLEIKDILSKQYSSEQLLFGIGKMTSGTIRNVVASETIIEGTFRTFDLKINEKVSNLFLILKDKYEKKYSCKFEIDYRPLYPPTINDSELYKKIEPILVAQGNYETLLEPYKLAEDFAFYQQAVPGIFIFLGCQNEELGHTFSLHNEQFDFDSNILAIGVQTYINLIEGLTKND